MNRVVLGSLCPTRAIIVLRGVCFSASNEIWVCRNVWVVTTLLKSLKFDDIKALFKAEMTSIINPLEDEIKTTSSYWVKIRNRLYIYIK